MKHLVSKKELESINDGIDSSCENTLSRLAKVFMVIGYLFALALIIGAIVILNDGPNDFEESIAIIMIFFGVYLAISTRVRYALRMLNVNMSRNLFVMRELLISMHGKMTGEEIKEEVKDVKDVSEAKDDKEELEVKDVKEDSSDLFGILNKTLYGE